MKGVSALTHETRGLAKDSLLLSVGKAATTLGMITQVSLVVHSLGLRSYGLFALTVSLVAIVDKFFDVDVSKAVITFASRHLSSDPRRTAGVLQFGYLVDLVLGVVGFLVVVAVAPLAGPRLAGSQGSLLFLLYGLTLLASTVDTTSVAVLQVLDRYRLLAGLVIFREATRVMFVAIGVLAFHSLVALVALLVVHDFMTGLIGLAMASRAFSSRSEGIHLRQPALATVKDMRRPMLSMVFQTNLITYGRLIQTQAPTLLLGIFHGPLEVGIFKIGLAGATAVGQVSDPAWNAVMPRLARLWSEGRFEAIRKMIAQGSLIAAIVMTIVGASVIAFRVEVLKLFGGGQATAAASVFALCVVAQVVNGILFWNDSLLYSSGRARLVTTIFLPAVALMLALVVILGRQWGANGAAVALLASGVVGNVALAAAALRVISEAGFSVSPRPRVTAPVSGGGP
jgi:O-antigen/teichoic acid export membrane protein